MRLNRLIHIAALSMFLTPSVSSASTISITYTGQVFGGGDNAGYYTFSHAVNSVFSGEAFTLTYHFDTSLGDYINTGTSYQLSGSEIGSAVLTINNRGALLYNPSYCLHCYSREVDGAAEGYRWQFIDWQTYYHGPGGYLSTSVTDPSVPGDITQDYAISLTGIGQGLFVYSEGTRGGAFGNLSIDSVVTTFHTPLPATWLLFATALGWLAIRRRRVTLSHN